MQWTGRQADTYPYDTVFGLKEEYGYKELEDALKITVKEEAEASFKVNTEREQWYDFGLGKTSLHWLRTM